jgi:hypothetical protein
MIQPQMMLYRRTTPFIWDPPVHGIVGFVIVTR